MMNRIKLPGTGLLALFLFTAPAFAQAAWEYDAWDADTDGTLSVEEFSEGFLERVDFAGWDEDGDGVLSETEFGGGIYSRYDADSTDAIEEAEYGAFERDFGDGGFWHFHHPDVTAEADAEAEPAEDVIGFEAWDIDGDGIILSNEFQTGFQTWGTFGEFDTTADGGVTKEELSEGIFARYDDDDDGLIEEPELADIGDDMGDEGLWDV
ncbi:hypothetical protein RAH32_07250 [Paracoccus sp. WLY502]|uniref:hypothetical protein n=1 Tax=Paracoccus yibinensis TaxID=3068891 RepID=UPI00279687D1|nr:hypothetical protein [Paracoccus sp. WLY502]MDQ1900236.1 hypothetical protein [Paracoccus sp. WLY502]